MGPMCLLVAVSEVFESRMGGGGALIAMHTRTALPTGAGGGHLERGGRAERDERQHGVVALGGGLGQTQTFAGPMAKQHRMAAITLGCLLGAAELIAGPAPVTPQIILWVVTLGALLTAARRLRIIARGLE